ncbi:MAG: ferritin [Spirochaetales bacterium]|nr:ferritin [Spirochaetales bacterium]
MSIEKEMKDAINDQINFEMESAYLYLSMAAFFEDEELPGFANWMKCQYMEETMHAMKLFNFLIERGGQIKLKTISAPEGNWDSYSEVFEETLKHEEFITSKINKLVTLSRKLEDYASESFLMWYVDEQVEEEDSVKKILTKLNRIESNANALYQLDSELSSRALSPLAVPTIMGQPTE